jgi:hypothetical protein
MRSKLIHRQAGEQTFVLVFEYGDVLSETSAQLRKRYDPTSGLALIALDEDDSPAA